MIDNKYRSRKWMLSVGVQLSATAALFMGLISGAEFAQISSVTVASYSFANAAGYFNRDSK